MELDYIDAVVSDGTETDAKMWEIAENLHRADLTALERSEHVAEWAELSTELSAERLAKEIRNLRNLRRFPQKAAEAEPVVSAHRS